MSSPRAQANHSLYLARILLQSWQRERAEERLPASVLAQAYDPAIRHHLRDAYGWFLLQVSQPELMPARPPHNCDQLPPVPPGRVEPGEIREFRQQERQGWLAPLLQDSPVPGGVAPRAVDNLAVSSGQGLDGGELRELATRLEQCFDRMGDSLDEY